MEKIYFSDFVEVKDADQAVERLVDLQKRFPASSFLNMFHLKLQPGRGRSRSRLLLTIFDRVRFHQCVLLATPVIPIKKDKPVLTVAPDVAGTDDDLQPVFVKHHAEHHEDRQELIDQLIAKFSKDAPKIIYSPETHDAEANYGEASLEEDPNIVSETLANIYAEQGCVEKAVQMFEILKLHFPEKSCYFAARIKSLQEQASNEA